MNGLREQRESAVRDAVREERAARAALEEVEPTKGWDAAQEAAYRMRLERWLEASRRLGDALQALKQRVTEARH